MVAQCSNTAIGGQEQQGYITHGLLAINPRLTSGLASAVYAQKCLQIVIAYFGKLPPLVCALGLTISDSNDCSLAIHRTNGVHCSSLSVGTTVQWVRGDVCRA